MAIVDFKMLIVYLFADVFIKESRIICPTQRLAEKDIVIKAVSDIEIMWLNRYYA